MNISIKNSLINEGDIAYAKSTLIMPQSEKVVGFNIYQDSSDFSNYVNVYYAISTTEYTIDELDSSGLDWYQVGNLAVKDTFISTCNSQVENYYLYFKFEKYSSVDKIIVLDRLNLNLQPDEPNSQSVGQYPYYYKSIFREDSPNDSEILGWRDNVLEKISGDNILPHYIEKDRDFSIFWGWIAHFFAIIVHFARKFKNLFFKQTYPYLINENNIEDIGEFIKQKGYIKDSRVQIDQQLNIFTSLNEIFYSPMGDKYYNGAAIVDYPLYYCSGFFSIQEGDILILKVGGYNSHSLEISENYLGTPISGVNITFQHSGQPGGGHGISYQVSLTAEEAKYGKKILIPTSNDSNYKYQYGIINYPKFGNYERPLYLRIFTEGRGYNSYENKTYQQIFGVHKDFRKRGTQSGLALARTILEVDKEDDFYINYLSRNNVGWFLNKNCPLNKNLIDPIPISYLMVKSSMELSNGVYIEYYEKYLTLNQNTLLDFNWYGDSGDRIFVSATIYDKNKNKLDDVILGNWDYNVGTIWSRFGDGSGVVLHPTQDDDNHSLYKAKFIINIIDDAEHGVFSMNDYEVEDFILKDNYLICKRDGLGNEAYYLKIDSVVINQKTNPSSNTNIIIGHSLNRVGYSGSNVSIQYNVSTNIITLLYGGNAVATVQSTLEKDKQSCVHFVQGNSDYGYIIFRSNFVENTTITLNDTFTSLKSPIISDDVRLNSNMIYKLRRLLSPLGFLDIRQYLLAYYTNHGQYSNEEAEELISQKVLPYNGYRLFIDNTYYHNDISVKLQLKNASFDKINFVMRVDIKYGIPPYTYVHKFGNITLNIVSNTYNQYYTYNVNNDIYYGLHNVVVTDALGDILNINISCEPFNEINYKIKAYLDIYESFTEVANLYPQIYVFGGAEKIYALYYYENGVVKGSKEIPAKTWIDLSSLGFTSLINIVNTNQSYFLIEDNIGDFDKRIDIWTLFNNFGIDYYDIGEGEVIIDEKF